jgi:hypothetical protein
VQTTSTLFSGSDFKTSMQSPLMIFGSIGITSLRLPPRISATMARAAEQHQIRQIIRLPIAIEQPEGNAMMHVSADVSTARVLAAATISLTALAPLRLPVRTSIVRIAGT